MAEDLTGRRLGHYKIDGVLGRGGMSVMYRATDTRLGRKVALKVMGEHITNDAEFRERFVDEARNTSAIDHAHIVPLYDFGEVDGLLYIAMRLVEGSDLAGIIKSGPMAVHRVLELLGQVAGALDMLHERGLVHLDLKPANVLVTAREAATEHVYLADFGLTRRGATGHRTSSGDFLGSPTYAAPEHLQGEPVDGRTDLYALSCVLFACLTGRPPFQGKVQDVIIGHLQQTPPTVTSLVVLPVAIDEVLRRGMSKDANQRYSTCRELIEAAKVALAPAARPGMPPPRRLESAGGATSSSGGQSGPSGPASGPYPGGPGVHAPGQPGAQQPPTPGSGFAVPPASAGGPTGSASPVGPAGSGPPGNVGPIRLRPPLPAQSTSFAKNGGGASRWAIPVTLAAVVALGIVLFVVFLA